MLNGVIHQPKKGHPMGKMMRILATLNVSAAETIGCDSGYIMQRLLSKELIKRGFEYHLLVPGSLDVLPDLDPATQVHRIDVGTTKYSVRFYFPWFQMSAYIKKIKPNVIFNNQIETTAALRALMISEMNDAKLISYCHYIPAAISPSGRVQPDPSQNDSGSCRRIYHHIASGVLASDVCLVQSNYAARLLALLGRQVGEDLTKYIDILSPPCCPTMAADDTAEVDPKPIVMYNHRLYSHYGTDNFIKLAVSLAKEVKYDLMIADPLFRRSSDRAKADGSPMMFRDLFAELPFATVLDGGDDRALYRGWLSRCRFSFAALRPNAVWSMSALDCLGMGVPVLAPRTASYPEFIPTGLLYDTHDQAVSIARRLIDDPRFWSQMREESIAEAQRFSVEITASKLCAIIDKPTKRSKSIIV